MILAASFLEIAFRVVVAVVLAVVTTSASLRLLGMRRGWTTALLAGAIGWGAAALLALSLSDWDWGADGLVLHIVAIAIPATMAVAVTMDLLARPGSLAVGERAGLVSAPRPLRATRRRISVIRRYKELVGLARKEGFGPFFSANARAERITAPEGVRLRRMLESAGGVYVKLGQIAATWVDLLPADVCDELSLLQNRAAPEPVDRMRPVLEAELHGAAEQVFETFDWEPLAAASIGQTYAAQLLTGEAVVVKIQRPDIPEVMERDLAALSLVAEVAQQRTSFGQSVRSGEVLDQFAAQPALRARLPPRGFGNGGDGIAGGHLGRRARPEDLPRPVHAPAPGTGEVRRYDGRRRRQARRVDRRQAASRGPAPSLDARTGASLRLLPRRSSSGKRLHPQRRLTRAHRLRRGGSTRFDPASRDRRHAHRDRSPRCRVAQGEHRASR